MKKILSLLAIFIPAVCSFGQSPKWTKKARLAQVTVLATDNKGTLHESQGSFINEQGDVITEFDALKGAVKATVVDAKGIEIPVRYVCGASSMYNVVRLATSLPEKYKMNFMLQAENTTEKGGILYVLPNAKADKKSLCALDTIIATTAFRDSFTYYTLAHVPSERMAPDSGAISVARILRRVVLPAPLSPAMATASPGETENDTSRRTLRRSYEKAMLRTSSM